MSLHHAGRAVLSALRAAVLTDLPFYILIAMYVAAAFGLQALVGVPGEVDIPMSWRWLLTMSFWYAGLAAIVAGFRAARDPDRRILDVGDWIRIGRERTPPARILSFLLLGGLLPIWFHVFVRFKVAIPEVKPFSLDVLFMHIDRIVHFGVHPWIALQPLLGDPVVTQFIDLVYYVWFPAVWITFIWQALHGSHDRLRSQYLLSFGLCWVLLGTVAATLLSSAGPIFFAEVTQATDPYEPLMAYLRSVNAETPLGTFRVREMLWNAYVGLPSDGAGISAMPSLHISMVVLMMLLGFQVRRTLGIAFSVFAVLIFVGSIHLAWHYAIDAYVSVAGTILIWKLSGSIVRRWHDTRPGELGTVGARPDSR
ncbi:MAG: phosphatase PAP2 family protein [Gemmatimonadota bacterium]|nr:phosphatase PAP2 family protein [Gemmatimonadota bacterium]